MTRAASKRRAVERSSAVAAGVLVVLAHAVAGFVLVTLRRAR